MNTPILLNDWAGKNVVEALADFLPPEERWDLERVLFNPKFVAYEVLLASYTYQDYEGDAFVLLHKDGELYEVNGGHCSCYGLEGMWEPERTTCEALMHRLNAGRLGIHRSDNTFANELRALLIQLQQAI